jgi:hypothetical protein
MEVRDSRGELAGGMRLVLAVGALVAAGQRLEQRQGQVVLRAAEAVALQDERVRPG